MVGYAENVAPEELNRLAAGKIGCAKEANT